MDQQLPTPAEQKVIDSLRKGVEKLPAGKFVSVTAGDLQTVLAVARRQAPAAAVVDGKFGTPPETAVVALEVPADPDEPTVLAVEE